MHTREEKLEAFGRLIDVLDRLRKECPWDKKQTNESLRANTIEETFELADALIKDDKENIREELGDVIMHVCFYALIGQEKGDFDIADVCNAEADKLIFRHPHIYGQVQAETEEQVLQNWEQIKLKEKKGKKKRHCPHSSKLTAYRTRPAMWASTGKRRRMYGLRCAKSSVSWRPS